MTTITGTLLTATPGTGVAGVTVTARLVASSEQLTAGGQVIRSASTTSGAGGAWSLTLTPLSALAHPVGAYYRVEADGRRWTITVPDTGTHELGAVLVDVPDDRGDVGLTQTAADARYLTKTGGTLTGALTLAGGPASDLQAATKRYVDDNVVAGAVVSVNDATGVVVLDAGDVGADPAGSAASALTAAAAYTDSQVGPVAAAVDQAVADALQKDANLTDVPNKAAARTALGLGGAALLAVGTTAGTVAAGDDGRFSSGSQRDPGAAIFGLGLAVLGPYDHGSAAIAVAAGVLILNRVWVPTAMSLTKLGAWMRVAGVTTSGDNGLAIYSSAGALLGQTVDMSAAFASADQYVEADLTATVNLTANTAVYLGILTHFSGGNPSVTGRVVGVNMVAINGSRPSVFLTGQASFPANITLGSASVNDAAYALYAR